MVLFALVLPLLDEVLPLLEGGVDFLSLLLVIWERRACSWSVSLLLVDVMFSMLALSDAVAAARLARAEVKEGSLLRPPFSKFDGFAAFPE